MVGNELKRIITEAETFLEKDGKQLAEQVVHAGADTIDLVVEGFLSDDLRYRQRIAWVLVSIPTIDQLAFKKYHAKLTSILFSTKADSLKRNILRLYQYQALPEKYHGEMIDYCFGVLENNKEAVAIQVFAMTVLERLIQPYEELKRELCLLLETNMENGTAGYKSRAQKTLKVLQQKR